MFLGFCCLYLKFFLEIVRFESREFVMQVHSGVDLRGGEQMLTNYPVFTHQCDQNPRAENLLADSRDRLASAITPIKWYGYAICGNPFCWLPFLQFQVAR